MTTIYAQTQKFNKSIKKQFSTIDYAIEQIIKLQRDKDLISGYYEKLDKLNIKGFKKDKYNLGFINYIEDFVDEDNGEVVGITRSMLCSINGRPCNQNGVFYDTMQYSELKKWIFNIF